MMASEHEVKFLWQTADCVCFDVDSTVCTDEAIDELAKFLGVGDQVAALTNSAMQGSVTYKQSLSARLNLMKPHQKAITKFLAEHPPQLTPHMKELMRCLHERKVPVYLISGGFTCIIEKVAEALDIPKENIFANKLLFYYCGEYAGFDESQPTSETGGKPKVIQQLKDKFGYKKVVHIGDGITDLEACPPADAFIGFGGNRIRENVKNSCLWFVTDMADLLNVLQQKIN